MPKPRMIEKTDTPPHIPRNTETAPSGESFHGTGSPARAVKPIRTGVKKTEKIIKNNRSLPVKALTVFGLPFTYST